MIKANTMQETTTKTRNYSLDLLRILACITVILCHTAGSPLIAHHVEPGTLWYNECLFMHSLTRWDIAIFVMLPGFFLLNPKKDVTISAILWKYVMRVLGALIFWSLFYGLTLRKSLYPLGTQEGHFWYLNKTEKQNPIREPDLMMVITGGMYGYRRKDGVYVLPLACLRP